MAPPQLAKSTSTSKGSNSTKRRKIEIKKVEETNKRHVTFSKRKLGLFNKVTELSILCQAETALIITSQNGKLYACGYPTPDTVIRRFLASERSSSKPTRTEKNKQKECVETLRIQYEATQGILKEEKKRRDEALEANKILMGLFPSWWEYSIDEMGLDELEQFKASLEQLKINLMATMENGVNSIQPMMMPFPSMLPMQHCSNLLPMQNYSNFSSFSNGDFSTKQEQAWDLRNNGIASSSNNTSFGTWNWGNNAIANSSHIYSSLHPNVDFGHYSHN